MDAYSLLSYEFYLILPFHHVLPPLLGGMMTKNRTFLVDRMKQRQ